MKNIRMLIAATACLALMTLATGQADANPASRDDLSKRAGSVVTRSAGESVHPIQSSRPADLAGVSITAPTNRTFRTDRSMIAVIEQGQPGEIRYGLPAGVSAQRALDGSVILTRADGKVAIIAPPWAKDAQGRSLRTTYHLLGRTLVQDVETHGAAFPVVADPRVTMTWWGKKQIYFNKSETGRIAAGGGGARLVLASVPGLSVVTAVIVGWALLATATGRCVQLVGTTAPNSPFVPAYHSGKYCR